MPNNQNIFFPIDDKLTQQRNFQIDCRQKKRQQREMVVKSDRFEFKIQSKMDPPLCVGEHVRACQERKAHTFFSGYNSRRSPVRQKSNGERCCYVTK